MIPARNEERAIESSVRAALTSADVELELIVLDDHSSDRTTAIVQELARSDPRLRLELAPLLPLGWCGKQHACAQLAGRASGDWLLFLDADVRLAPAAAARLVAFAEATGAALVSGFPRQQTGTLAEQLCIPLMHFVLLGFLPLARMRASTHPAYGAGCGQLFLARRASYEACGGHTQLKASLHDGVKLPRAFRAAGMATDLCDATLLAECRMYRSAGEVWRGLAKNATEGLGAPRTILPATLLLIGGQMLPAALLVAGLVGKTDVLTTILAAAGTALAYAPRLRAAALFRQSWLGAALHPLGVAVLVAIQWVALGRYVLGMPSGWKGRTYVSAGGR